MLLLFNFVFTEGFFRVEVRDGRLYGVLIDILNHGSKVMLLALGMALVIATSGVDLSVGAVMAIAGAVAAQLINMEGVPFAVVIAAALAVALLAGAWNGLLVGAFTIQPIVATLILMVAGRGVAQLITEGQIITFTDPRLTYVGNGSLFGFPFPVWLSLGMLGITVVLTRKTAIGLFVEAVGDNQTASVYAGVNGAKVKFFRLCVLRLLRWSGWIGGCFEHQMCGRQSRGSLFGVRRYSCCSRWRYFPHGGTLLPGWSDRWSAFHSDPHYDDVHAQCKR